MLLSAVSVLVVVQSSSEIPEGLMNNPVLSRQLNWEKLGGRQERYGRSTGNINHAPHSGIKPVFR